MFSVKFAPAATWRFSAASSITPSRTTASRMSIWSTTPTLRSSSKTDSSCRKMDCSRASMKRPRRYDKATWNYEEGGNETGKVATVPGCRSSGDARVHPREMQPGSRHRLLPDSKAATRTIVPKARAIRLEDRRVRRPWPAVPLRRPHCRRMSPTISRCNIRAASISY